MTAVESAENITRKLDVWKENVNPATDPDTGLMQSLITLRPRLACSDFAGGGGRGFRSYTKRPARRALGALHRAASRLRVAGLFTPLIAITMAAVNAMMHRTSLVDVP